MSSTEVAQRRPFSPEFAGKALVTRTSMEITDALSYDEWVQLGEQLTEVGDSMAWWTGDWIEQGKRYFGGKYDLALEVMRVEKATLEEYAYVARHFSDPARRLGRPNLSWWHYRLVAALDAEAADEWLDRADESKWSGRELREQLRASRQLPPAESAVTLRQLKFTVPDDRAQRWERRADDLGLPFDEWALNALDAAAA